MNKKIIECLIKLILAVNILLVFGCGSAIGTLIELSHNEKLKEKAAKEEAEKFERLKFYIFENKLQRGASKKFVIEKIGYPNLEYLTETGIKFVYFKGTPLSDEKIYLFFDKNGSLINLECIKCK
ncbi:MAG: hypothetical protein NC935_00665 [Candidatus Omnitrophica bacterium]|nr:hypothetical protein [Candidatus Omnitrophota bacterium]